MVISLQQYVADMVTLESQIEEALNRRLEEVKDHAEVASAVKRFHTMVKGQRRALQARLSELDGGGATPGGTIAPSPFSTATRISSSGKTWAVSNALHEIYTAFTHAALSYAMLHAAAHRLYDLATAEDLATQHMKRYAGAAQEIHQLIADVVSWELSKDGQECRCVCDVCGLGLCICASHGADELLQAWGDQSGPYPRKGGLLLQAPRAGSAAARLGLRNGDIIIAADGQEVRSWRELYAGIAKHKPGEEVLLRVRRGVDEPMDVAVTRLEDLPPRV